MHGRGHKVPWKILKRPTMEVRKQVYMYPDPTLLKNYPFHALGDLVGIKKYFHRKHSIEKQWKFKKCSKGYAVQSDYKSHLETYGTRGHSCDCCRVFSRSMVLTLPTDSTLSKSMDHFKIARYMNDTGTSDPVTKNGFMDHSHSTNKKIRESRSSIFEMLWPSGHMFERLDSVGECGDFLDPSWKSARHDTVLTNPTDEAIGSKCVIR
ncbi:hypothetical protein KI387_003289 [Taxus chinensis]|uniref:Uncharacterized protein n=1 Tax=Taxus chinensis TaxID=29808 RepID=A0AA38GYW4_TAXCH|nr:hypothetical protein KI387_003289 [Taxus chinensis]